MSKMSNLVIIIEDMLSRRISPDSIARELNIPIEWVYNINHDPH